jgi:hypothetical protein
MSTIRPPLPQELSVITMLAQHGASTDDLSETLRNLRVKPMSDGGMGSLLLLPAGCSGSGRILGEVKVSGEFFDTDGVMVSITLNYDKQGQLFELDMWKVDFSPLCSWPDPSTIRITPR